MFAPGKVARQGVGVRPQGWAANAARMRRAANSALAQAIWKDTRRASARTSARNAAISAVRPPCFSALRLPFGAPRRRGAGATELSELFGEKFSGAAATASPAICATKLSELFGEKFFSQSRMAALHQARERSARAAAVQRPCFSALMLPRGAPARRFPPASDPISSAACIAFLSPQPILYLWQCIAIDISLRIRKGCYDEDAGHNAGPTPGRRHFIQRAAGGGVPGALRRATGLLGLCDGCECHPGIIAGPPYGAGFRE